MRIQTGALLLTVFFHASPALPQSAVTLIEKPGQNPQIDKRLAEDVKRKILDISLFSPAAQATIRQFLLSAGGIVEQLAAMNAAGPLQIGIVEDMIPNAYMYRSNDTNVLLINLGLLKLVENDAELAGVLAHEVRHLKSEMEKELGRRYWTPLVQLLYRKVENEVDVGGVADAVKLGFTPHAFYDFLNRMASLPGAWIPSHTHPMAVSRRDLVGAAILHDVRVMGAGQRFRLDDKQRPTEIVGPMKVFLASQELKSKLDERIAGIVSAEKQRAKIQHAFEVAKNGWGAGEKFFHSLAEELIVELEPFVSPATSAFERATWELTINLNLNNMFEEIQRQSFGEPPVVQKNEQREALNDLALRSLALSHGDFLHAYDEMVQAEKDLAKIPESDSSGKRATAERKLKEARDDFAIAIQIFEEPETVRAKLDAYNPRSKKHLSMYMYKDAIFTQTFGARYFAEMGLKLRLVSGFYPARGSGLDYEVPVQMQRNAEASFAEFIDSLEDLAKNYNLDPEASRKLIEEFIRRASREERLPLKDYLENFGDSVGKALAKALAEMSKKNAHEASQMGDQLARFFLSRARDHDSRFNVVTWAKYQVGKFDPGVSSMVDREVLQGVIAEIIQQLAKVTTYEEMETLLKSYQHVYSHLLIPIKKADVDTSEWLRALSAAVRRIDPSLNEKDAEALACLRWPEAGASSRLTVADVLSGVQGLAKHKNSPLFPWMNYYILGRFYFESPQAKMEGPEDRYTEPLLDNFLKLTGSLKDILHNQLHRGSYQAELKEYGWSGHEAEKAHEYILKHWADAHPFDWRVPALILCHRHHVQFKAVPELFKKMWAHYLNRYGSQLQAGGLDEAAFRFWMDVDQAGISPASEDIMTVSYAVVTMMPTGATDAETLRLFNQYMSGVKRFVEHIGKHGRKAEYFSPDKYKRPQDEIRVRATDSHVDDLLFSRPDVWALADPAELAQALANERILSGGYRSDDPAKLIEFLWNHRQHAGVKRVLLDPNAVGWPFASELKWRLSQWQIEESEAFKALKKQTADIADVRQGLPQILDLIDLQFHKENPARNQILSWLESTLVTNEPESELVHKKRVSLDKWKDLDSSAFMDSPYFLAEGIGSNEEKIVLLRYLTGVEREVPKLELKYGRYGRAVDMDFVTSVYERNGIVFRTLVLNTLLDESRGLLSEGRFKDQLIGLVLGEAKDDFALKTVLETYLETVPASEAKFLMARILASYERDKQGRLSLRQLLQAGGPLGAKVAQFLVTSHLVKGDTRRDLMDFFSQAEKPDRIDAIRRAKEVLGPAAAHVVRWGEIKGSGSINYAIEVFLRRPDTGQVEAVVVRMQKDHVPGQIANEDQVWVRVAAKLKTHADPRVRRMASLITEMREYAMSTLSPKTETTPEGVELNHEVERGLVAAAQEAYRRGGPDARTGFTVDVADYHSYWDAQIPAEHKSKASIYPSVAFRHLPDVEDAKLRAELARQIMQAEIHALFELGLYDPDGHVGNWVIDLNGKRLLRIDYTLMATALDREHRVFFRELMVALLELNGMDGEKSAAFLAKNIHRIFSAEAGMRISEEEISEIVNSREYRALESPVDRLLQLQHELESRAFARGSASGLPFQREIRVPLAAISRISMYSEYVSAFTFARLISGALNVPPRTLMFRVAQKKTMSYLNRLLRPLCERDLVAE